MSQAGGASSEQMCSAGCQPLGGRAPLRSPSLRSGSLRCARPPNGCGREAGKLIVAGR
jgi:hypothetical protein